MDLTTARAAHPGQVCGPARRRGGRAASKVGAGEFYECEDVFHWGAPRNLAASGDDVARTGGGVTSGAGGAHDFGGASAQYFHGIEVAREQLRGTHLGARLRHWHGVVDVDEFAAQPAQ